MLKGKKCFEILQDILSAVSFSAGSNYLLPNWLSALKIRILPIVSKPKLNAAYLNDKVARQSRAFCMH